MEKTYYDILEIPLFSDKKTIREAYRNLAKKTHPDRGGNEILFKKIKEAYEFLMDHKNKILYDEKIKREQKNKNDYYFQNHKRNDDFYKKTDEEGKNRRRENINFSRKSDYSSDYTFFNIFNNVKQQFNSNKKEYRANFVNNEPVVIEYECSIFDLLNGFIKDIPIKKENNEEDCNYYECKSCSGKGKINLNGTFSTCILCKGEGVIKMENKKEIINININITPFIEALLMNGEAEALIEGYGNIQPNAKSSNLILKLKFNNKNKYYKDGHDLIHHVNIKFWELLEEPTNFFVYRCYDGSEFKIEKKTLLFNHKEKITFPIINKGFAINFNKKERGNLLIIIDIDISDLYKLLNNRPICENIIQYLK